MNKPTDNSLYNKIKKDIYKKNPKHSAYRSGILVKTYKKEFLKKYGKKKPYTGKKTKKRGLKMSPFSNKVIKINQLQLQN